MRRDIVKGVETRRLIGDVKDMASFAPHYRFVKIQAPKPSRHRWSTQAPPPTTVHRYRQ
jgi:hypothetical protein